MRVRIKGSERASKTPYGSSYYVIVRLDRVNPNSDVRNREVFMFVNSFRMADPILAEGELHDVCPGGVGSTPWKCYDETGKVVDYKEYSRKYQLL